jgi:hypothetical protein
MNLDKGKIFFMLLLVAILALGYAPIYVTRSVSFIPTSINHSFIGDRWVIRGTDISSGKDIVLVNDIEPLRFKFKKDTRSIMRHISIGKAITVGVCDISMPFLDIYSNIITVIYMSSR